MSSTLPSLPAPGSDTPAPIRSCDLFSEDIHLMVDGELGVAETALVEEHLQSCQRCLAISVRLEGMSSLLKDWDVRTNDLPAPALRIRHGVLTRVAEHSVRRRRESRVIGLMQYATAALVLISIGLGVAFGLDRGLGGGASELELATRSAASPEAAFPKAAWPLSIGGMSAGSGARFETSAVLAAWSGDSGMPAPGLVPLAATASAPEWDRKGEWSEVWGDDAGRRRVAFLAERLQRQQALAEQLDSPVTYWPGPRIDEPGQRLLTISALNFLHDKGYLEDWKLAVPASKAAASRTAEVSSVSSAPESTDMTVAEMLSPMPGIDRPLDSLFKPGLLSATAMPARASGGTNPPRNGSAPAFLLQALPLQASPLPAAGAGTGLLSSGPLRKVSQSGVPQSFMDPLKAEANKRLRLREEDDGQGSVVFIVEDTREPIFIPAGQFIDGGLGARVVAEPVWLPPSKGKTPRIVRCRMVERTPLVEGRGHPTLVPFVAGPTIRALLADNASPARVRAAARRIYALRQYAGYDLLNGWSLLDVYGGRTGERYRKIFSGRMDWKKGRGGFVVRDAQGRLAGIESVRFRGPAAEELLLRLWIGYLAEAVLRQSRLDEADPALTPSPVRTEAEVNAALAAPRIELAQAFQGLAKHAALFRLPRGFDAGQGWRISSLEIAATHLHVQALEIVAGQPMVVSVVAGLQR